MPCEGVYRHLTCMDTTGIDHELNGNTPTMILISLDGYLNPDTPEH